MISIHYNLYSRRNIRKMFSVFPQKTSGCRQNKKDCKKQAYGSCSAPVSNYLPWLWLIYTSSRSNSEFLFYLSVTKHSSRNGACVKNKNKHCHIMSPKKLFLKFLCFLINNSLVFQHFLMCCIKNKAHKRGTQ